MAGRVKGFGRRVEVVEEHDVETEVQMADAIPSRVYINKDMLDEAVGKTLEGVDDRTVSAMKRLWSGSDNEVAHKYFSSQVQQRMLDRFADNSKRVHLVNEALSAAEVAKVSEYAPEFNLKFTNSVGNEHGLFSARRGIDHQILTNKFPASLKYLDFGGSVRYHVLNGNQQATVVAPFDMDQKDPTRHALTKLSLKKIAADAKASEASRVIASSVLRGDQLYHIDASVQTVQIQARASIAVHVYDVPIRDWAAMMERCGVTVHTGCLHFSNEVLVADAGVFEHSGAYFNIDRERDVIYMRMGNSSGSWYEHRWSDYILYAADQILYADNQAYSYKVVERRQDTIFYRIVKIASTARPNLMQFFTLPDIPMVEVKGFEVFSDAKPGGYTSRRTMVRKDYVFPQALWERMIAFATAEIDRGSLSYDKLYNYYRTLVPRQTLNAVYIGGGQSVPLSEVPALVVHAAVVAYADTLLMQRTIRAKTDAVMKDRERQSESTLYKALALFMQTLVTTGKLLVSPIAIIPSLISRAYVTVLSQQLVTWQPQVRIKSLNLALIIDHKTLNYAVKLPNQLEYVHDVERDMIGKMVEAAKADAEVAKALLSVCGSQMSVSVKSNLEAMSETETLVQATGSSSGSQSDSVADVAKKEVPGVTWFKRGASKVKRTVLPYRLPAEVIRERRMAVEEAILECENETAALLSTCSRIADQIMLDGKPNEKLMRDRREQYFNPDLWLVRGGKLIHSVLNPNSDVCNHSGVYLVRPEYVGERLLPVVESRYEGPEPTMGKQIKRDHSVLTVNYTGYALVIDSLKIFNGPAVIDVLRTALQRPDSCFDFSIVCHQGPPGCGKSTTVCSSGHPDTEVFLTPTRVAKDDLSEKLAKHHSLSSGTVWLKCRTLDSLLVNHAVLPAAAVTGFDATRIDEYVLARAGKWIAAAVLLGVRAVHAYGDSKQISHKPRVQVPSLHLELRSQVIEEEYLTHRNAAELVATYNHVYDNKIRTTSKVAGTITRCKVLSEVKWMKSSRLLTMYQADKKYLMAAVASMDCKPIINTVHEAQGSDCDQVVLYNSEVRKRGPEDSFYLYGLQDYCLVAISRARCNFTYVKMSAEPDGITAMMDKAKDPRRVQNARDIDTQGQDVLGF